MTRPPIILLIALACGATPAAADELSAQRRGELVQQALNAFDDAVNISRHDPQRAAQRYRESAAAYEALRSAGVRNAALEYNLGNAYFRLHDTGRAVLAYRRALAIDPSDPRSAANLAYARDRVEPFIKPTGSEELLHRLQFLSRFLSQNSRLWLAAAASVLGWVGLWIRLRTRVRAWMATGLIAIGGSLVFGGSLLLELHNAQNRPAAVVIAPGTVLRQGRGEGYEAAIKQTLGSGVEVVVLHERGDWCEVRLANGVSGWVPSPALAHVEP
ncbi:MAG: tetratricopeptide repeat protein [Planctomycetes bacterium]|nr:tetratricopeptide repeat protein [Planctomycetota bacterium]